MPELTRSGPTNYRHDCENIRPQGLQCNLSLQRLKANQPSSRLQLGDAHELPGSILLESLIGACEFDQSPQAKMAEIALSLAMRLVQEISARILQEIFMAAEKEAALLRDVPENTRCHPIPFYYLSLSLWFPLFLSFKMPLEHQLTAFLHN